LRIFFLSNPSFLTFFGSSTKEGVTDSEGLGSSVRLEIVCDRGYLLKLLLEGYELGIVLQCVGSEWSQSIEEEPHEHVCQSEGVAHPV